MVDDEFSLKKNAVDSLEEALNFLGQCENKPNKIRICILLLDNFLELFFKNYICCTDRLLIFQKPSANDFKTVTLSESVIVIKKIGYTLEGVFEQQIDNLRKLRNNLQHHEAKFDPQYWKVVIGEILYYALNFDEKNNNLFNIKNYISPNKWDEIVNLKNIFEKHWEASKIEAKEQGSGVFLECPECNLDDIAYSNEDGTAYCCFCRRAFPVQQCGYCGEEKNLSIFSEDEDGNIDTTCKDCWIIRVDKA